MSSWYNASWKYRQKIEIDNTKVSSDQTDFPVYLDLSNVSVGFWRHIKSDGSDIVVTEKDGETKLKRELVAIDTGKETGELHFKAPSLSSSTKTVFYIYYGNAAATETNDTDTWNTNYKAVWHSYENTGSVYDST